MEAKVFVRDEREETTLTTPDQQVEAARQWFASPRFAGRGYFIGGWYTAE